MRHRQHLPEVVEEIQTTFIPMPDGIELAASVWLPEAATEHPVPAILEYIPYRRRDMTAARDAINHPYLAAHGYASVRVDLRGSGDSGGLLLDEYLEQELVDAECVIAWLRQQPWCNGRVGMMGISWGGFNALQVAARRPVGLDAIVTVCSTDDRYSDDVHFKGGCLLGDNLSWAATMFAYTSLPPDPDVVGERWRELWRERLSAGSIWLDRWLEHQRRDDYWRHGSVRENYGAIEAAVLAVSGWADGYSNAVFRLLEHLKCPRLGLIGPWGHKYPHQGVPGPAIGFLQEILRFWDHWLKDEPTGIMDEPTLRVWLQDSIEPATAYEMRPGRWVGEACWPSPRVGRQSLALVPYSLVPESDRAHSQPIRLRSPLTLGEFAGKWCSFSALPQLPPDQRQEDGGALIFDSEPLTRALEILGAPELELELTSDTDVALLAVRLSDVRPDRATTRVTYGVLNLTHRNRHDQPEPMEPGKRYGVRICLNHIAHHFPQGHRIRLALSTSYWPLIWTPPRRATLEIHPAASVLHLPTRDPERADAALTGFPEPEGAAPLAKRVVHAPEYAWRVIRDLARDHSTHEVVRDEGCHELLHTHTLVRRKIVERYSIEHDNVDSARGDARWSIQLERPNSPVEPGWSIRTFNRLRLRGDARCFHIDADVDAYDGDRRFFSNSVHRCIRRVLL